MADKGIFASNGGQVSKKQETEKKKTFLEGVVCTNPGNPIAPVFKRVYNKKLDANIVTKVDETNIFEFVQASKSTTDLAVLQKRFIELGEIPNVNSNIQYGDTAVLPGDIHALYKMVNDVDGNFKKLPESVQKVFGDSQTYLQALLDGSYNQKLTDAFNKKSDEKNEPEAQEGDK